MIKITTLQTHQIMAAKWLIAAVAQRIYYPAGTPQAFYDVLAEEGELRDVDNFQEVYERNHGLFLAVMEEDRLVGTGALKRMDDTFAELKRMWLLEEYHGRGIGYQVFQRLLKFARGQGYTRIRLQTGRIQTRACQFYTGLGFVEIPSYRESMDDVSMELVL